MKNLLYAVTLLALATLSIAQTELKINADIRGRNCAGGLGLCSVSTTVAFEKTNPEYKTTAFKLDETTIALEFNKTLLSEEEQKSLLNTTLTKMTPSQDMVFTQEQDIIIDTQTLVFLGIAPKYNTIKKGNYPLVISDDTIKVTFQLWQQ
jgi:hypothetical protein